MELELPIPLNQDYEERIFASNNLSPDCDIIGGLVYDENDLIVDLVKKGEYHEAALKYLQLAKSMCRHFIIDEHWTYFDDYYTRGEAVNYLTEFFTDLIEKGTLPEDLVSFLLEGWKEVLESECYQDYCYPTSVLGKRTRRSTLADLLNNFNR